ncbi:MAG TPA: metal-dependent hydrolase [Candidatus Avamphibacillus intestinigallinarum]|nr:metal-dependent hydrolase [Candidatus Avamphibacillus intestinigallinarum]
MKGISHAVIGAAVGYGVAALSDVNATETIILLGAGSLSALIPDLDTNGKLTNHMTMPFRFLKFLVFMTGVFLLYITWFQHNGLDHITGSVIGVSLILISQRVNQRLMLSITGVGVVIAGVFLVNLWMIMFGIYIFVASFLSHRTYTHSIVGLVYFSYVAFLFAGDMGIPALFPTTILGYISHLLADTKFIPTNKQGVKLLLPFTKRSF